MASFAQSLRDFRRGNLSLGDLLLEIDRILADGRADVTWFLTTLSEENKKNPFPAEALSALQSKLQPLVQTRDGSASPEGTGRRSAPDEDLSRVQLATAYRREDSLSMDAQGHFSGSATTSNEDDPERIKGTGDVLNNRFELEQCVGSGGMSTVYKAVDRRKLEANDRNPHVAVKVLNLEFSAHPDSLIALQRETKKCQSLAHPNIVRVYDFDRDGSTVYMTMEYLSGESLGRKVDARIGKGMAQSEALRIINDMGKALRFAHDFGIVHADFKPANVFITDSGNVKVIDFGIARAFQNDGAFGMEATRFDPGSLGALTPTYASPEMLEQQEPDPRDDIYGLACAAYEMLTGRHPFGRMQATAARDGGLQLKHHEALTRSQFKALKHALEFDREKRTPTVNLFLEEMNREVSTGGKLAAALGLIGVVVIAGAAAGYYYLSEFSDESPAVADPGLRDTIRPATTAPPPVATAVLEPPPSVIKDITLADVNPLLAKVPCAALNATISAGKVYVRGYARAKDVQPLKKALSTLTIGGKIDLSGIEALGQEKCAIIDLMSGYWNANRNLKQAASITSENPDNRYLEGEPLVLDIATPNYESFVNVDYYSLDGGVLHMVPSPRLTANQAPPSYNATIGDLGEWIIAEPFGTELIVLLATPEPLFEPLRDEYERQTKYLPDLEKRLAQLAKKVGKDQITADFILIRTKEGKSTPNK